jgi:transposase
MEAISVDLRTRIVDAYNRGEGTQASLARTFEVSERWIQKLFHQRRESDSILPLPHGGGRQTKVGPEKEALLKQTLVDCPDATLEELRDRCEIEASIWSVSRALRRMGMTFKKSP